jgi:PEP-CTERM motif-containing protein
MSKKVLLLSLALLVASWAMAPAGAQAVSCISVPNVTLLPAAGCDLGGLTFSNFTVSATAGFTAATVGLGAFSTVSPNNVNLLFQLAPTPGIGPGDVLLSYGVTAGAGQLLTGIDLTNDAIIGPVTIGEVACRVPFTLGGTCAPADRLAALVVNAGGNDAALFASPVSFAFLHKDIAVGVGGFISDFSNSHSTVPEPATLLLFGTALAGMGVTYRRRKGGSLTK